MPLIREPMGCHGAPLSVGRNPGMHVTQMSIDNTEVDSPTWQAIDAALNSLDGENVSELSLSGDTEFPWLSIAGGKDGYVTVQFASGIARLFTLRDAKRSSGLITMVFAGQRVSLDRCECVTVATARQVARRFFTDGDADNRLHWEPA